MKGVSRAMAIIWAMELISRPQGATMGELVEELGASRRSVYRILEDLPGVGFKFYGNDYEGKKVWHK